MERGSLKIAITGHIDHGKSTLIGRLLLETKSLPADKLKELKKISKEFGQESELAYLADQLKEEREKKITIETTEIYCKTKKREYCFIDTPGHLEFIKNMMTGTSRADLAFLLIDAQEGVREQTRRHSFLIKLLSIPHVIVIINKMDLIGYDQQRFHAIAQDIEGVLHELKLSTSLIIPVSAKAAENISRHSKAMPWYQGPALLPAMESLESVSASIREGPLRFPVQDIYEMELENVVVGQIASGRLLAGQTVRLLPQGETAVIKEIKIFGKKKSEAVQHESIGVILEPDLNVQRGQIISDESGVNAVTHDLTSHIVWLTEQPLQTSDTVHLRCATQECDCIVEHIYKRIDTSSLETLEEDASALNHHEAGIVQLQLQRPVVFENYQDTAELGRFVIERDDTIQGIGIVYEHHP